MADQGPRVQKTITKFTEDKKRKNEELAANREMRRKVENEQPQPEQQVTEPVNTDSTTKPKIKHKNVPMFKTLRKLGNKLEQVNHHYDLLMDFQKRHQAPRGLKVRVNPSAADLPIDLYTKWEEIHANFSLELTEVLITHWKRKRKSLNEDITAALGFLQNNTDKDELNYITELVQKCRISKKEELTERREKRNKKAETDTSAEEQSTEQEETS